MRFFSRDKPKIKVETTKKDAYSGWIKCSDCHEMIHAQELEQNQNCCPKCDYHYRLPADLRLASLADPNTFVEMFGDLKPADPLQFADTEDYPSRLKNAEQKGGSTEAVTVGTCELDGHPITLGIFNFNFMGGSMGSVVGERLTRIIEHAVSEALPLIIISTSGGARMQESTLSLMQMAKTAAALSKLDSAGVPFISVLTNPTTGGVSASFASLGDIIIAEPKALICFAGPRVIEQTIGQKLPEGAQKSEFLLKHGLIDCIVRRHELKRTLSQLLNFLSAKQKDAA